MKDTCGTDYIQLFTLHCVRTSVEVSTPYFYIEAIITRDTRTAIVVIFINSIKYRLLYHIILIKDNRYSVGRKTYMFLESRR